LTAPDNNDIEIQEEEGKSKCMWLVCKENRWLTTSYNSS
jgi:hypothetical protein